MKILEIIDNTIKSILPGYTYTKTQNPFTSNNGKDINLKNIENILSSPNKVKNTTHVWIEQNQKPSIKRPKSNIIKARKAG